MIVPASVACRLAAIALAILACGLARGADESPPKEPGQPRRTRIAFTEAEVHGFIADVVPQVERVMERKFKHVPAVVVDDPEAIARLLADDMEPMLRKLNPGLEDNEITRTALSAGRAKAREILGKYGIKAGKLGLLPANLGRMLRAHRIDPRQAPGIVKAVIAHELTHALQAEAVDLIGMLAATKSDDAEAALNSMIEGQAMFVQDRVARALGVGEADRAYAKTFSADVGMSDPSRRPAATRQEFIYIEGKRFVEWRYAHGGAASVWQSLARPPIATSMIARPATYSPTPAPGPELGKVFAALAGRLHRDGWTIEEHAVGEIDLRVAFAVPDRAKTEAITEPVVAARAMVARRHPRQMLHVTLLALTDRQAGKRLVELLDAPIAASVQSARQSGFVVKTFEHKDSDEAPIGPCRTYTIQLADAAGHTLFDRRIVLAARGRTLIEVYCENHPIEPKGIKEILDDLGRSAGDLMAEK